jgi:hypothetical protein
MTGEVDALYVRLQENSLLKPLRLTKESILTDDGSKLIGMKF